MFAVKRVYDAPEEKDGFRVLTDRLWARGLTKEKAAVDLWLKDVAPSTELRKWFSHDAAKWEEFKKRYHAELDASGGLEKLRALGREHKRVTLLYGARDSGRNQAVALAEFLGRKVHARV